MRERTFRKPTVRELFSMQGVEIPKKLSRDYIFQLMNSGVLDFAGHSYREAVGRVEGLKDDKRLILFPSKFRVEVGDSNQGIKSLDDLMKIDGQQVLRDFSGSENVPSALTKDFTERFEVWPYALLRAATKYVDMENPPIGYYWVGGNGDARAVTWLRATAGAEMEVMKKKGDFHGEIMDKVPYARNLRVKVNSRTEKDVVYKFSLFRLPMHSKGDLRQYSDWRNLSHNSSDPDTSYRGGEHEKRVGPVNLWSATTIFAYYAAMNFVGQHPGWRQFRINPFCIPKDEKSIDFIDNLRLRSFILHERENGLYTLEVLNKTEIEKVVGARTGLRGYDSCWRHWGKKDIGYLYNPIN